MRAVGYVRVSTREQDEVVQIRAIEEFARERGMEVVKFYVDRGETGAKAFNERPGARLLLEEIESVKPDCIVAWSIDRVGRTMLDTIQTIIGLEERGYRVMTVRRSGFKHWTATSEGWFSAYSHGLPSLSAGGLGRGGRRLGGRGNGRGCLKP